MIIHQIRCHPDRIVINSTADFFLLLTSFRSPDNKIARSTGSDHFSNGGKLAAGACVILDAYFRTVTWSWTSWAFSCIRVIFRSSAGRNMLNNKSPHLSLLQSEEKKSRPLGWASDVIRPFHDSGRAGLFIGSTATLITRRSILRSCKRK
jgi:hypothetical protein